MSSPWDEHTVITDNDVQIQVKHVFGAIDLFFRNSSLGEFSERLRLLFAFYRQLECINFLTASPKSTEEPVQLSSEKFENQLKSYRSSLANVALNVYMFYEQFESKAHERISHLRQPLEKEITDYAKLVSWKDVNYDSMKMAAEKTQRTLHKAAHRYEGILSEPVSEILACKSLKSPDSVVLDEKFRRAMLPQETNNTGLEAVLNSIYITPTPLLLALPTNALILQQLFGNVLNQNESALLVEEAGYPWRLRAVATGVRNTFLNRIATSTRSARILALESFTGAIISRLKGILLGCRWY